MLEGAKTRTFDMLSGVDVNTNPLYASLFGMRESMSKKIGVKTLPIIQHDNTKRVLEALGSRYPFAFLKLTSIGVIVDRQNVNTIRRTASSIVATGEDVLEVYKGYLFDTNVNMEITFTTDSLLEAVNFCNKLAIYAATDAFDFELSVPGTGSWNVQVKFENNDFQIPTAALEDEENPKALEMTFPFVLVTKTGIIRSVAKVNHEGRVNTSITPGEYDDAE